MLLLYVRLNVPHKSQVSGYLVPTVGFLRKIRRCGPSLGALRFQKTRNISCTLSLLPVCGSRWEFSASSSSHLPPAVLAITDSNLLEP